MAKHEMPPANSGSPAGTPASKHAKAPKPKNTKARRAVAITLAALILLGAAGGGGYYYLQHRTGKAVNVYPAMQLGTSDNWYDRVNTGGQIRADRMQAVYLSSTQTVTEVFVTEGQQVNVGDPILAFDTTLDEVELTRKQIAIDQLDMEIEKAQKTLKEIDTYKIGSPGGYDGPDEAVTPAPTAEPASTAVPWFQGGQGTEEDPYVFLWDENASLIDGTVDYLLDMAHGYGVPEVTTGPDVPLDPDQMPSQPEEQQPDAGLAPDQPGADAPAEGQEPAIEAVGEPAPIGAGQSHTVTRLLAPLRAVFRDPVPPVSPEGGEPAADTPVPADTSVPTDTPVPDQSVPEPAAPSTPPRYPFETMSADEIMGLFADLSANPQMLAAYYTQTLTDGDILTILGQLSADQIAALQVLLTDAGVADPFPTVPPAGGDPAIEAPVTDAPAPDTPVPDGPAAEQTAEPTAEPTPEPTPEPTSMPVGVTYFMVFEVRANNSMQGDILRAFEIQFTLQELEWQRYWAYRVIDPMYMPRIGEPMEPDMDDPGSYGGFDDSVYYTASEIAQMRAETQREISAKTIQLNMARQDLKQVEYELSNGQVLATTAGVVKSVLDPDEALQNNEPVVKISGGGGYFITPYMSEFDMQYMHVGDTVTVENYMAGETLDGVITEISRFPSQERYPDYYSSGANSSVSVYPFTVSVSEEANLRDGYYVNVYFSAGGARQEEDPDAFYLENAFLRTEGGKSYVYAAGPDGLLEKRFVTTGRNLYGSLTEITGGLDPETDYLAFPYGRSVKPGAATVQQEDIMVLYNGY